jgi:hypothetical protein
VLTSVQGNASDHQKLSAALFRNLFFTELLSIAQNGRLCFASFTLNRFKDAIQPVSF